jgi:hypothetical protein
MFALSTGNWQSKRANKKRVVNSSNNNDGKKEAVFANEVLATFLVLYQICTLGNGCGHHNRNAVVGRIIQARLELTNTLYVVW